MAKETSIQSNVSTSKGWVKIYRVHGDADFFREKKMEAKTFWGKTGVNRGTFLLLNLENQDFNFQKKPNMRSKSKPY